MVKKQIKGERPLNAAWCAAHPPPNNMEAAHNFPPRQIFGDFDITRQCNEPPLTLLCRATCSVDILDSCGIEHGEDEIAPHPRTACRVAICWRVVCCYADTTYVEPNSLPPGNRTPPHTDPRTSVEAAGIGGRAPTCGTWQPKAFRAAELVAFSAQACRVISEPHFRFL